MVAANIHQLDFLLEDLPDVWLDRLAGTWPGPNTWLVPHQERLPEWVTGVHDSVAVRVTDHPLVQELCHLTGPLISTSANPAGARAAAGGAILPRRAGRYPRRRAATPA